MTDFPGYRGDPDNPVNEFQGQFYELLERYEETVEENPATVAALLVEYVDSLRILYDLDLDGGHLSEESDLMGIMFEGVDGERAGWLNAPRVGDYHDIDREEFKRRSDVPVEIHGDPDEDETVTFEFGEREVE